MDIIEYSSANIKRKLDLVGQQLPTKAGVSELLTSSGLTDHLADSSV